MPHIKVKFYDIRHNNYYIYVYTYLVTTQNYTEQIRHITHKVCDVSVTWDTQGSIVRIIKPLNTSSYLYTCVHLTQILIVSLSRIQTYLWGLLVDIFLSPIPICLVQHVLLSLVLAIAFFSLKEKRWNCPDVLQY